MLADKKQYNKKSLKIIAFVIAILAIIYSGCWFFVANKIKAITKDLSYEQGNWKISNQGIKVSGFPFKFNLKMDQIKLIYDNKALEFKIETIFDTLEAETGPLFTHIKFKLPKKITADTYYDQKFNKWSIISDRVPEISLEEKSLINSFKIAELIYNPEKFEEQEYGLEELHYIYKDLNLIDSSINQKIFHSNTDSKIKIYRKSNNLFNLYLKSSSDIKYFLVN